MLSIGIGELQKNTSIFKNIKEAFEIVDKRKNKKLATVYPYHKVSVVDKLAGKYRDRVAVNKSFEKIKEDSFTVAMKEKYGFSY